MKTFILALLLFSSSAFAGEMVLTENYSIAVNLADSAAPDTTQFIPPQPAPFVYTDPDRWSSKNTYLEITYLIFHSIDWLQTINIAENPGQCFRPGYQDCYETNVILGKYPSTFEVNRYFLITALAHFGITYNLTDWRLLFQATSIGYDAAYVVHNFSIGISPKI